jgi:DNA-binding beta-propeller fold protein YncE
MFVRRKESLAYRTHLLRALCALALVLIVPASLGAKDKKAKEKKEPENLKKQVWEHLDLSRIVWPNPPAIARVKFLTQFVGEKPKAEQKRQKVSWMDRMAGVATGETRASQPRYVLVSPYGVAVDSKGQLYVADAKVGGIFIASPDTYDVVDTIRNGRQAHFKLITGVAIDDADNLFVSDSVARHVLAFDPQHRVVASINEGMSSPAGMAIDNENRFLYVCDTDLDQVLVYDADPPYKLLRKIGTAGKDHTLTEPGQFSRPTNAAVDSDGNLYVSDTFNDRVEEFDADGGFIRTFGKPGDGPGYFARPKGIAIDSDGHVWVADTVQDRIQVFTREGRLLLYMGGHGELPGQFSTLSGLTIDQKTHRVIASEQWPGRVQIFRYVTDEEALAEKKRRDEMERQKSKAAKPAAEAPASEQAAEVKQ